MSAGDLPKSVKVAVGAFAKVVMRDDIYDEYEKLDAKRRGQLEFSIEKFAERGPQVLPGNKFQPDEGRHEIDGWQFRLAAFKTHQARLYGAYTNKLGVCVFVIGGIDAKKKQNRQKLSILKRAARQTAEAAKAWDLI